MKARLEESQMGSDPRRALEIAAKEKQARLEADAQKARERALKRNLAKAKQDAEIREEKRKKEAADRRALELLLAEEERQDSYALGVALDSSDDDSASTVSQEEKHKEPISEVVWEHLPGSKCRRGVQYVGVRRIVVSRPQLQGGKHDRKPAGAIRPWS